MSVKEENEITIKITCSNEQLIKHLTDKGFCEGRKFTLDDYYLIPKDLKLDDLTTRDILSKAVIIRYIVDDGKIIQKITFKKKDINGNGEILSQKAINCDVLDYKAGINLFNELGYYQIMNIKESDIIYYKDKLELAIKFIENSNTLIEIETDDNFKTIVELKQLVTELEIPIEKGNYFVKKAENELNKILKR
ncbi:adenylyl cyclase CyaB [Clostridium sp. CAG:465]|nr:adenylyl cyclase CyaB [Clostridium sp. CAG:465]